VEKPSYDLLANNPYIDEIIIFEKKKFKTFSGFWQQAPQFIKLLRSRRFDTTLDLQALFKSGIIAYLSGARRRLVYCNTRELSDRLSKRICGPNQTGHVVERYLDVVRALGCRVNKVEFPVHITAEEAVTATDIARQAGLDIHQRYVILSPGANWPNKRWDPSFFGQLADRLYDDHLIPVLTGGPGDQQLAAEIVATAAIPPVDLCGKTSLKQLAYLITKSQAFVGGDTGPMHLAAALGTPVVALHGPTDIIRNGPYGNIHRPLVTTYDCAGCWKRKCPKEWDCLDKISVDAVHTAIGEVLHGD
jgi:heptosyltransferase-1